MAPEVSVILPCYNEERVISRIVNEVSRFSLNNKQFEFLFVDDGSTDKTPLIIQNELKKLKNPRLKLISYSPNRGKGYAIKKGVECVEGQKITFLDSDLAYSLEYLKKMNVELDNCDMIIGSRTFNPSQNSRRIRGFRILMGRSYNLLLRIILRIPYRDTQAGIKGFRKNLAKELFNLQKLNNFSFDVEKIYLAIKMKNRIKELPVIVAKDHINSPTQVKIVSDSAKMFLNLFQIRLNDFLGKYEK